MKGLHNYKVYVKTDQDTTYRQVKTAIFPFKFGMLLDERLDEAYITILGSDVKTFKPTTRVKIELIDNAHEVDEEIVATKYYIIASDTSIEMPVGSGTYKHELYLIEPTKLLEGLIGETISFTNSLGSRTVRRADGELQQASALVNASCVQRMIFNIPNPRNEIQNAIYQAVKNYYLTPVQSNAIITLKSASEIADVLYGIISRYDSSVSLSPTAVKFTTMNGEEMREYGATETPEISINNNLYVHYYYEYTIDTGAGFGRDTLLIDISYEISTEIVKYPTKRYTVSSVIDRLLDVVTPLRVGETPKYRLAEAQRTEFGKIMSPEATMTKCTLREQLKVVGGFLNAEARLGYTDEQGNYNEDSIYFDKYGEMEESSIDGGYIENRLTHSIDEYCTEVRTGAQNIVNSLEYARGTLVYPDAYGFTSLRTDTTYARIEENNAFIPTLEPIQEIVSLKVVKWGGEEKDITPFLYETSKYQTLSSYEGVYPYAKAYALHYTQGQNNVTGLFFKARTSVGAVSSYLDKYSIENILNTVYDTDIGDGNILDMMNNYAFRITYKPITSSDYSHGKQYYNGQETEFAKIYNQSENVIEMQYFGEHIKGVSARLGNVDEERTYYLPSIDKVPKIGTIMGDMYVSAVSCEWLPFALKCTVALSKDFNRRSQYIGVNSQKRVAQISEREAYERSRVHRNYCVLTRNAEFDKATDTIFRDTECVARAIATKINDIDFTTSFTRPTTVFAWASDKDGSNPTGQVMLPVMTSTFGNVIEFRWRYKDNYSAGDKTQYYQDGSVSGYWQTAVPYGDYYGRVKYYNFALIDRNEADGNAPRLVMDANQIPSVDISAVSGDASNIRNIMRSGISTYIGEDSKPTILRKDSREKMHCGVSVEFKADRESASDLIIGSELAKSLILATGRDFTAELRFLQHKVNKLNGKITANDTLFRPCRCIGIKDAYGYKVVPTNTYINDQGDIVDLELNESFVAWAITTPIITETTYVTNDDGIIEEQTITKGGDILVASNDITSINKAIYVQMAKNYK